MINSEYVNSVEIAIIFHSQLIDLFVFISLIGMGRTNRLNSLPVFYDELMEVVGHPLECVYVAYRLPV